MIKRLGLASVLLVASAAIASAPASAQTSPNVYGTQVTVGQGCGADKAFPTSIAATGTALVIPACSQRGAEIDLPPGSSAVEYVALAPYATAAAAIAVSHTLANPASATSTLIVTLPLSSGENVYVTAVTSGTATATATGSPTFRGI